MRKCLMVVSIIQYILYSNPHFNKNPLTYFLKIHKFKSKWKYICFTVIIIIIFLLFSTFYFLIFIGHLFEARCSFGHPCHHISQQLFSLFTNLILFLFFSYFLTLKLSLQRPQNLRIKKHSNDRRFFFVEQMVKIRLWSDTIFCSLDDY